MRYAKLAMLIFGIILIAMAVSSRRSRKVVLEEGTFELIDPRDGITISPAKVCVSGVKLNLSDSGLGLKGRVQWDRLILKVSGPGNVTLLLGNESRQFHFIDGGYVELPTGNYSYSVLGDGVNLTLLRAEFVPRRINVQTDGSQLYVTGGDFTLVVRGNGTVELIREGVNLPLLIAGAATFTLSLVWVMRGAPPRGREEGGRADQ